MSKSKERDLHMSDLYKNFRFVVLFEKPAMAVAGFNKVSEIKSQKTGRTKRHGLALERGVTHDPEFDQWAKAAIDPHSDFRRTVTVVERDEVANEVRRQTMYEGWVDEYHALAELDGDASAIAIEHMRIKFSDDWTSD